MKTYFTGNLINIITVSSNFNKLLIHDSNEIDSQYLSDTFLRTCGAQATFQRPLQFIIPIWYQFVIIETGEFSLRASVLNIALKITVKCFKKGIYFTRILGTCLTVRNCLIQQSQPSRAEITNHTYGGNWQLLARSHKTCFMLGLVVELQYH